MAKATRVPIPKGQKPRLWSMKKADDEFSLWIRNRDKRCIRCGREENLTCSHFWGRQHKGTRYDPDNCDAVCWMPCHIYHFEKEKQGEYRDFKLKQLGKKRYQQMEAKARGTYPLINAIIECMKLLGKL